MLSRHMFSILLMEIEQFPASNALQILSRDIARVELIQLIHRLLSHSAPPLMRIPVAAVTELFLALTARIRFLSAMDPRVDRQSPSPLKCLPALCTLKRSLSSMSPQMPLQISPSCKRLQTHITSEPPLLFLFVHSADVIIQILLCPKRCTAFITFKIHCRGCNAVDAANMLIQMAFIFKRSIAMPASKWPLLSVHPLVPRPFRFISKRSIAKITLKPPRLMFRGEMDHQTASVPILLIA